MILGHTFLTPRPIQVTRLRESGEARNLRLKPAGYGDLQVTESDIAIYNPFPLNLLRFSFFADIADGIPRYL